MNPHDAPTASQLLEAVREWIERDVVQGSSGRLSFHARVAANMLAIVERELELGSGQALRHAERLSQLGCESDHQLATAISNGQMNDRQDLVRSLVRASVVDKLRVANPGYLVGADAESAGEPGT